MRTGRSNTQPIINDFITGKIVLNNSNSENGFPAFIVLNNFATSAYAVHTNTKNDYSVNVGVTW